MHRAIHEEEIASSRVEAVDVALVGAIHGARTRNAPGGLNRPMKSIERGTRGGDGIIRTRPGSRTRTPTPTATIAVVRNQPRSMWSDLPTTRSVDVRLAGAFADHRRIRGAVRDVVERPQLIDDEG